MSSKFVSRSLSVYYAHGMEVALESRKHNPPPTGQKGESIKPGLDILKVLEGPRHKALAHV